MSWVQLDDTHWHLPLDPDRHLLLHSGDHRLFAELHGSWRHLYRAPEQFDPAAPLADAWHFDTVELPAAPATDEEGWQVLADAVADAAP